VGVSKAPRCGKSSALSMWKIVRPLRDVRSSAVCRGGAHPYWVMSGAFTGRTVGALHAGWTEVPLVNGNIGTGRALTGDAMIVFLLLNEIRRRIVMAVFGVRREDADHVSMVATASGLDGAGRLAGVVATAAVPSVAATLMGAGAAKEAVNAIAGASSRTTPAFGALLAFALAVKGFRPGLRAVGEGMRSVEVGSRKALEFVGGR
jgi:hypothetical protein